MLISLVILVAAVGWISQCSADPDIVSKWKSYEGDEAVAMSALVMVYCSCNVTGPCNITMAAHFYLNDGPKCYNICDVDGDVQCAYCRHPPQCLCSAEEIKSYHLCRTGNKAVLSQCYNEECTSFTAVPECTCDTMIRVRSKRTAEPPVTPNAFDDGTVFNRGLLIGLAVGGGILLLLVLLVVALVACLYHWKRSPHRGPTTRRSTNSSLAPIAAHEGIKGVNNPTYDNDSRFLKRSVSVPKPSTTSYVYPYAPRLAASRQNSTGNAHSAAPRTSTQAPSHYQELTPRAGDQPPTYEDSEGYTHPRVSTEVGAGASGGRRQPVYMELMRPSDRSGPRPPVDTYMY